MWQKDRFPWSGQAVTHKQHQAIHASGQTPAEQHLLAENEQLREALRTMVTVYVGLHEDLHIKADVLNEPVVKQARQLLGLEPLPASEEAAALARLVLGVHNGENRVYRPGTAIRLVGRDPETANPVYEMPDGNRLCLKPGDAKN